MPAVSAEEPAMSQANAFPVTAEQIEAVLRAALEPESLQVVDD